MLIHRLNALEDNYIWIIQLAQDIWIVDPGESQGLIELIDQKQWQPRGILLTHHHYDHTNGVEDLLARWPKMDIYAGHLMQKPYITHRLKQDDQIQLGDQTLQILETPGHTLDHIAFYNAQALFCGDTLFAGGCGRVFEGTAEQMTESLLKLRQLGDNTQVYCGHEYTLTNLNFALIAEAKNPDIQVRQRDVRALTKAKQACVPSSLGLEKRTNPFLRFDQMPLSGNIAQHCGQDFNKMTPASLFAQLRSWKDALDKTGELDEQF